MNLELRKINLLRDQELESSRTIFIIMGRLMQLLLVVEVIKVLGKVFKGQLSVEEVEHLMQVVEVCRVQSIKLTRPNVIL